MGHERTGTLPKSQRWRSVVEGIAGTVTGDTSTEDIARQTLANVRRQYGQLEADPSTRAAFHFLLELAVAARQATSEQQLRELLGNLAGSATPLRIARALRAATTEAPGQAEYRAIAESAAITALANWYDQNRPTQASLFESISDPFATWQKAGNGAGFCELSRLFFGQVTQQYLSYFLDREASRVLPTVEHRDRFGEQIAQHVDGISQHAFETAKITQSYAAGWFNKFAVGGMPPEAEIDRFLSYAFGKLRAELLREGS